ncbi:MAG: ABC transporter permease subunit [Clostridia bacterium]|nr:ABC transporter permease subunit [Clostridia bacterium]
MSPKLKTAARHLAVAVFWFIVWEVAARAVNQVLLIPSPLLVCKTLTDLVVTTTFWRAVGITLLRILLGFFGGVLFGSLLALLTFHVSLAAHLLHPMRQGVRAIPVASFIILALIWLPTNLLPAFIAFLMVLPIVWSGVEQGLREVDKRLLDMAAVYKLGFGKTLRHIRLPAVAPFFRTACVNALGLAWKSGIAAEVICRPKDSIGRMLQDAKTYLETPEVFAWTAVVILLSLVLEKLLTVVIGKRKERRAAP